MFTLKNGIIGGDTLSTILMYLPILIVTAMASLPIWKNTYLKLKDKKYMGVLEIAFLCGCDCALYGVTGKSKL